MTVSWASIDEFTVFASAESIRIGKQELGGGDNSMSQCENPVLNRYSILGQEAI